MKQNGCSSVLYFLVLTVIASAAAGIVALLAYIIITAATVNTPSQAIAIDQYREASGTTREEAEIDRVLGETDHIINEGQADKIRAQAYADAVRMEAAGELAQATGVKPGEILQQSWQVVAVGLLLALAAVVVVVWRAKRTGP